MKIKRIMSILVTCALLLSMNTMAYADDVYADTKEYLEFNDNPLSRINSDGTFDFEFIRRVKSGKFTANANQIVIVTEAYIYKANSGGGFEYEMTNDVSFIMTLYNENETPVGSYIGYCNGVRGGYTYNVTPGNVYYIELTTSYPTLADECKKIKGDGYITNITVN